jgi:tetratricopeptide (TPR) repeat protein
MLALHQYSHFNDTVGLRISFDHLVKVYMSQKKYSQAKWFILQSNSLSRAKNDPVNIIASLITLSTIKSEQKDYTLAMGDLNEALQISQANHYKKTESEVLKNYALLYSRLKNYPKEEAILKKRDSLEESIRKDEQAKLTASLAAKDSAEKKKPHSTQVKKKVYTSNTRKLSKSGSARKVATL